MAQDIQIAAGSGQTLYAVALNAAGQAWNGAGFEAIAPAHWGEYAIALMEAAGSGIYQASFPAGAAAGDYAVIVYQQDGAAPAATDTPASAGAAAWTGTGLVTAVGGVGSGQDPASQLFLNARMRAMAAYVDGKYTYDPATGTLTTYDVDNETVLTTATMTFDENGNITERAVSGAG